MGSLLVNEAIALYVVMAVALVVWGGIFVYLLALGRRVRILEKEVRKGQHRSR